MTINLSQKMNAMPGKGGNMGFIKSLFQSNRTSALQQAYENDSVIGKERHINNQKIIDQYISSNKPLDILAVAISYEREGASYRPQAIEYFERFLSNPAPIPSVPHAITEDHKQKPMFSYWMIYSALATLYEREYDFENAIKYLRFLPKESNYDNPADFTRIGDILLKIDVDKAVAYYKDLKSQPIYKKFAKCFDRAYADVLDKQAKGYKYKPRIRRDNHEQSKSST